MLKGPGGTANAREILRRGRIGEKEVSMSDVRTPRKGGAGVPEDSDSEGS